MKVSECLRKSLKMHHFDQHLQPIRRHMSTLIWISCFSSLVELGEKMEEISCGSQSFYQIESRPTSRDWLFPYHSWYTESMAMGYHELRNYFQIFVRNSQPWKICISSVLELIDWWWLFSTLFSQRLLGMRGAISLNLYYKLVACIWYTRRLWL